MGVADWGERAAKQEGILLGLLTAAGYSLFTLIPNSHSLMVAWPWVLLWQAALGVPLLWFLQVLAYQRRVQPLGNGFDGVVLLLLLALAVSGTFSAFPNQARWYGWALLGGIAVLYPLGAWLRTPERRWQIVRLQGYLTALVILVSLGLWLGTTIAPAILNSPQGFIPHLNSDTLESRNWAPFGHQNYVAGYLLLALPPVGLLAIEAETAKGRRFWIGVLLLGLLTLYTTFSRGGGLGLLAMVIPLGLGWIWYYRRQHRFWWGFVALVGLAVVALANDRLRRSLAAFLQGGQGSELAYRWITTIVGWRMGAAHPLTGNGLGSVPLWYQHYRPVWAGREAEWIYQLHSTPVQLWAELGFWGIAVLLLGVALLVYWLRRYRCWWPNLERREQRLAIALYLALWGYGALSLTDFQLDNLGIGGLLLIELTLLTTLIRSGQGQAPPPRLRVRWALSLVAAGLGILLAMVAWLTPIHRAWASSSEGFLALLETPPNWNQFSEKLFHAQELVPWEPYYPLQLGWNYGQRAISTVVPAARANLLDTAIREFQKGTERSPYLEFGYNSLGWLYWRQGDCGAAIAAFGKATQLMPAKRGNFLGLGLCLISTNHPQLAQQALILEVLRHPIFMTSPAWRVAPLAPFYQPVLTAVTNRYRQLEQAIAGDRPSGTYVHQVATLLRWWQGTLPPAEIDEPLRSWLQGLMNPKQPPAHAPKVLQTFLKAWNDPSHRHSLLAAIWPAPPEQLQALVESMAAQTNPLDWLRSKAPAVSVTYTRSGFGVNSRHLGGPPPTDFSVLIENLPMATFLAPLWPDGYFIPEFDQALAVDYQRFWASLEQILIKP